MSSSEDGGFGARACLEDDRRIVSDGGAALGVNDLPEDGGFGAKACLEDDKRLVSDGGAALGFNDLPDLVIMLQV